MTTPEQRKKLGAMGYFKTKPWFLWFPTEEQKKENRDKFISDWQKDVAQQKEIQYRDWLAKNKINDRYLQKLQRNNDP
jgi:hypothetical protein